MSKDQPRLTGGERRLLAGAALATCGVFLTCIQSIGGDADLPATGFAMIVTGVLLWARGAVLRSREMHE